MFRGINTWGLKIISHSWKVRVVLVTSILLSALWGSESQVVSVLFSCKGFQNLVFIGSLKIWRACNWSDLYRKHVITISPCFGSCPYAQEWPPGSLDLYLPAPVFTGDFLLIKLFQILCMMSKTLKMHFPFCRPESRKKPHCFQLKCKFNHLGPKMIWSKLSNSISVYFSKHKQQD